MVTKGHLLAPFFSSTFHSNKIPTTPAICKSLSYFLQCVKIYRKPLTTECDLQTSFSPSVYMVCVCVEYMCGCTSLWRPEVDLGCLP